MIDFHEVFRCHPDALILLTADLDILEASDAYLTFTGKARENIVGEHIFKVFPQSDESDKVLGLAKHFELVLESKVFQSQNTFRYDLVNVITGEKLIKFWRASSSPMVEDGKLTCIIHRVQDVTDEVSMTQVIDLPSSEVYKLAINAIKDYAIFFIDVNGRVRTWNPGAQAIKLYDASEIIGKHFSIFYTDEDKKANKPEWELETAQKYGRVEDENWRKRKDDTRFWANVVITPVYDHVGKLLGYVKVTRDLTERKMNEENIVLAFQESTRLKSEFLANMSHEIRTPMNGLMSSVALLMEEGEEIVSSEQKELLRIIRQSGRSIVKLVNDILDYSKMESDRVYLVYDVFDVQNEMHEVIQNHKALITGPIELVLEVKGTVPLLVKGDRLRFHQVLTNLVDNAIKFTLEGTVKVTADKVEETDDDVVLQFTVQDTGIGMEDEDVRQLFTPFSQLDQFSTKRYGGTGLGLVICKRLIALMKGKIWVESVLGEGSTFHFTISLKKQPAALQQKNEKRALTLGKSNVRAMTPDVRILVAEDNVVNQKVAMRVLKRLGYQNITIVQNGSEAVELMQQDRFDLILMDIQMPVMDGIEATHRIRAMGKQIPIIALTANAVKGDAEKYISAGMNDYISKPIDIGLFATLLNHWSVPL